MPRQESDTSIDGGSSSTPSFSGTVKFAPYDPREWINDASLRACRRKFNNRFYKSWQKTYAAYASGPPTEAARLLRAFGEEFDDDDVCEALIRKCEEKQEEERALRKEKEKKGKEEKEKEDNKMWYGDYMGSFG